MLNLNYNINKALGGGGCIGAMKYNYSASIVVAGGGGGGNTGVQNGVGGGGGGGMAVTQSISIIPNLTYQINVGAGGAVDQDAIGNSFLIGWDDNDTIPISFFAGGGKAGSFNGGDSGTGSLVRGGIVTSYPAFTGGIGSYTDGGGGFGPAVAGGGGASNQSNGSNGTTAATQARGGNGAGGITAGGGGGARAGGPTPPPDSINGVQGTASTGAGVGGNGSGVNPSRGASAGGDGTVIISYTGKQKAFVTGNVSTTYSAEANTTTHRFSSGSGTFVYTFPYPWEEPVIPYTVEVCPEEKAAFIPSMIANTINETPISSTTFVNGYSSSFNVKNQQNTSLLFVETITGSKISSFQYQIDNGVTASLTSSINNVTGSTTMSIFVKELGIAVSESWFNPSTTQAILTSSFLPINILGYTITGSVIYNKGNISNTPINWGISGSKQSNAQFDIKKDASVLMVSSSVTQSNSGTFNNEYAFNITSSLNGKDYIWYSSSSFKQITQSLSIPEIGINLVSYTTASYLTASWVSTTDTASYNVTASVLLKPYEPYFIDEYIMIGGGAAGGDANGAGASGGGGGAGGVVSGSGFLIQPDSIYVVTIGAGGVGGSGLAGGGNSSFVSESFFYLNAYGGGGGCGSGKGNGESGGSGGGAMGGPAQFGSFSGGDTFIGTGSGTFTTFGNDGGNGYAYYTSPSPGFQFELSGGGGGATGAGANASTANFCADGGAGGTGIGNLMIEYTLGISGSVLATGGAGGKAPGGCSGQSGENGASFVNQYSGQGGSGARGSGVAPAYWNGGTGASGSFVLKYLGAQRGRGGTVSYDGTYTYHTFTANGIFYSTANQLPDYQ